jgi:hypothetical protein
MVVVMMVDKMDLMMVDMMVLMMVAISGCNDDCDVS